MVISPKRAQKIQAIQVIHGYLRILSHFTYILPSFPLTLTTLSVVVSSCLKAFCLSMKGGNPFWVSSAPPDKVQVELTPCISSCAVQHRAGGSKAEKATTLVRLVALIPKGVSSTCEGESHRTTLSSDSAVLLPKRNDSLAFCQQDAF